MTDLVALKPGLDADEGSGTGITGGETADERETRARVILVQRDKG